MAKAEDRQMAQCVEQREFKDRDNKVRYSYLFVLDGEEFEIPESKYFKPVVDKWYYPVVSIAQRAELSGRTGKPYISRFCAVSWHEVN